MDPYLLGLRCRAAASSWSAGERWPPAGSRPARRGRRRYSWCRPEVDRVAGGPGRGGTDPLGRGPYADGDCAGAWLVCACTDDPAVNAAVAAAAERSRPGASAPTTRGSRRVDARLGPAGDVRVGVLSGDPRHSAAIRDAIAGRAAFGPAQCPARTRPPRRSGDHRRRARRSRADHGARAAAPRRGRRGAHGPAGSPRRSSTSCAMTSRSSTRARSPTAAPWPRSTSTRR
jgi:hypothetical protein